MFKIWQATDILRAPVFSPLPPLLFITSLLCIFASIKGPQNVPKWQKALLELSVTTVNALATAHLNTHAPSDTLWCTHRPICCAVVPQCWLVDISVDMWLDSPVLVNCGVFLLQGNNAEINKTGNICLHHSLLGSSSGMAVNSLWAS